MRKLCLAIVILMACGALLGDGLPAYWLDYLPGRAEAVRQDMKSAPGGDTFLFITDCHAPDNNMLSPQIAEYLMKKTGVKLVVLGGDYMNGNATAAEAAQTIDGYISRFSFTHPAVLRGNHDTNYQGGERLPDSEFARIVRKVTPDAYQSGDRLYYYIDNKKARIRYILLDTSDEANTETGIMVDQEQRDWLRKTVLETPRGWRIRVFQHILFDYCPVHQGRKEGPWMTRSANTVIDILDSVYDKARAEITAVISGHVHMDHATRSRKGYPIISTTCDAGRGSQASYWDHDFPLRPSGTINEQVIDAYTVDTLHRKIIVRRIGCGIDREYAF